jgi:hypothetical protein
VPPRQGHVLHELGAAFNPEGSAKLEGISQRLFRNLRACQTLRVNADRRAPTIAPVQHIGPSQPRDAMMAMLPRNGILIRAVRSPCRSTELVPRACRMLSIQCEQGPERAIIVEPLPLAGEHALSDKE